MRNAAPLAFDARVAARRFTEEEVAWFFNVPSELAADADPKLTELAELEAKIQIGPLDV